MADHVHGRNAKLNWNCFNLKSLTSEAYELRLRLVYGNMILLLSQRNSYKEGRPGKSTFQA